MRTQADKAARFRELHQRSGAFIIPNPWDAGSARLLAAMGFEALATTSLGLANTLGRSTVSLDAIIENCRVITEAGYQTRRRPCTARSRRSRGASRCWNRNSGCRCSSASRAGRC